jgi:hypothetical protein
MNAARGEQRPLSVVPIAPPPAEQRRRRSLRPAPEGKKRDRYALPEALDSACPVGYRTRVPMTADEVAAVLPLLSLDRPAEFVAAPPPTEQALFEETSLGVMTARQSTNFRGHRDIVLGPDDSRAAAAILRELSAREGDVLDGATHTHLVFCRPYRTPFTFLLTFIGHDALTSPISVAARAWRKRFHHADDIPTIRWLMHIHLGVLADAMERAAIIASAGARRANSFVAPFCDDARRANAGAIRRLEDLAELSSADRAAGWRLALVSQVGAVAEAERPCTDAVALRKLGANLLAFRSERIQPGVNHEEKAPPEYHERQTMDVPDELTVQAGRAAYNAFAHWTGCDRDTAKAVLLLERIDVLTPDGRDRIREVREMLDHVTDRIRGGIPTWADAMTGWRLSSNVSRGKKAFALAGQRVYIGGLSFRALRERGLGFELAARAFGAAAARSALVAELMGVIDLPADCDLLAGICLMAGPVNQNDIGKSFFGQADLLAHDYPDAEPTSLLVWTLKAKTVADPIGNEEQLMNRARKGALVDLRPGPHEVVSLRVGASIVPLRRDGDRVNQERAFGDLGNFVRGDGGEEIPGNVGSRWPAARSTACPWAASLEATR